MSNERITGIIPVTTGPGPFAGAKNISLILTSERILCVRPDRLLIPHWWGYEQDNLLDHFRTMHPDAITAEFPDTLAIPVNTIRSLFVRREFHPFMLTDDSGRNWHIVIITGSTAYEFFTANRPYDLLENPHFRKTLQGRLRPE